MILDRRYTFVFLLICSLAGTSGCFIGEIYKTKKLNQILKSGNYSLRCGQYTEAIRLYNSGLAIAPNEPTFLANKSVALRLRGVDTYNKAVKLIDEKTKSARFEFAKKDFRDSTLASAEAVKSIRYVQLLYLFDGESLESHKINIFAAHAESMRLFATIVDKNKVDEALKAMHEYIDIESNQEKKTKAQLDAGKMLIDTGKGDQAINEYKKILSINPDHTEALLGVGLALSQSGDTEKYRQSEYYLQRFVDQSPDNHPLKADIKNTLDFMKSSKKL